VLSTSSPPVAVALQAPVPRFTKRETGYSGPEQASKGDNMGVLWLLVILLIILALVGGVAVNNWLFLVLLIALILVLVGGV
jgi:hypothetical protein